MSTSLRGLWKDCDEWDRRYLREIDRTNTRSTGSGRTSRVVAENQVLPAQLVTAGEPADSLLERGST